MKKPEITNGEWKYGVDGMDGGVVVVSTPSNQIIADVHGDNRGFDAKAISAVPEMIEALLHAHNVLWPEEHEGLFEEIESALKKAGCYDNS